MTDQSPKRRGFFAGNMAPRGNGGGTMRGALVEVSSIDPEKTLRGCRPGVIHGVLMTGPNAGKEVTAGLRDLKDNPGAMVVPDMNNPKKLGYSPEGAVVALEGCSVLNNSDTSITLAHRWASRAMKGTEEDRVLSTGTVVGLMMQRDEAGHARTWKDDVPRYDVLSVQLDKASEVTNASEMRDEIRAAFEAGASRVLISAVEGEGKDILRDDVFRSRGWDADSEQYRPVESSVERVMESMKPRSNPDPEGLSDEKFAQMTADDYINLGLEGGARLVVAPVFRHMLMPEESARVHRSPVLSETRVPEGQPGGGGIKFGAAGLVLMTKAKNNEPVQGEGCPVAKIIQTANGVPLSAQPHVADPEAASRYYETLSAYREGAARPENDGGAASRPGGDQPPGKAGGGEPANTGNTQAPPQERVAPNPEPNPEPNPVSDPVSGPEPSRGASADSDEAPVQPDNLTAARDVIDGLFDKPDDNDDKGPENAGR